MRRIPHKFLGETCYWCPKSNGPKYKLENIRIDDSRESWMEHANNQHTFFAQYILYYQPGVSKGLPEDMFFSDGDIIICENKWKGVKRIKKIEFGTGRYGESNQYEILIN